MAYTVHKLSRIGMTAIILIASSTLGCNQNRYQPSEWRSLKRETTLPGTTLPGTTLPGTTLPGTTLPGTTLPGTTLPGTTLPRNMRPSRTQNPTWQPNIDYLPGTTLPKRTQR